MKNKSGVYGVVFGTILLCGMMVTSCTKDNNNNNNNTNDPGKIATADLVAYFPFESNGNDMVGSLTPATSHNVKFVAGRRGNAYQGDTNSYFLYDLPANSKLTDLKAFSISMWFYGTPAVDGVPPVPGILQINGTSDPTWGNLCLTQDRMPEVSDSLNIKLVFHKEGAVWNNQFVGFPNKKFIENMWLHLVFTYDNVTSKYMVYVNGDPLVLSAGITDRWAAGEDVMPRPALGDLVFSNATKMSIGGWMQKVTGAATDDWMGYFTGKMDELRIYDRALTTTEVKSLFEAEVSKLN